MFLRFLDVIMPERILGDLVKDNIVWLILLLIALLLISVGIVSAYVIKKDNPSAPPSEVLFQTEEQQ